MSGLASVLVSVSGCGHPLTQMISVSLFDYLFENGLLWGWAEEGHAATHTSSASPASEKAHPCFVYLSLHFHISFCTMYMLPSQTIGEKNPKTSNINAIKKATCDTQRNNIVLALRSVLKLLLLFCVITTFLNANRVVYPRTQHANPRRSRAKRWRRARLSLSMRVSSYTDDDGLFLDGSWWAASGT